MDLQLPTPESFPAFPYDPPYTIQTELMRHIYEAIEGKKVAIVESPTGTGKTLTLLCSALTWLADEKERAKKGKMKAAVGDDATGAKDWVIEQALARVRREMEVEEEEYEKRLALARKREELIRRASKARVVKRKRQNPAGQEGEDSDDEKFLPEDQSKSDEEEVHISPALKALMAKVHKVPKATEEDDMTCTKIYYASRTHSQLSQVLPELNKLRMNKTQDISVSSYHPETQGSVPQKRKAPDEEATSSSCHTRTVALGSRKQLCINDDLRARVKDIDEACREILGEKEDRRCQYLPPIGEDEKMLDFRDMILATPKDIEDLATAGRAAETCPYFGARKAIPQAQLITLPYNLLLQASAREALGIDLKDQIVLIDEAHNLIPTLLSLSTHRLSSNILVTSLNQVYTYVTRFKNKLLPANMLQLKRLVVFLEALKKYVEAWKIARSKEKEKTEVTTVLQMMSRLDKKAAGINLLEVEAYLKKSKIAKKISGYADKQAEKNTDQKRPSRKGAIAPLSMVEDFMVCLTNTNEDGRVTLTLSGTPGQEEAELKYQLLNPSPNFLAVVEDARAVVLAGGTMSPISDVVNQLFSHLPSERITSFSCGHIIPEDNLQTLVIGRGPGGSELQFKADKQNDPAVIAQVGQVLLNFSNIIPAGMIVFFPSYKFLNTVKATWTQSGLIEKLALRKQVFYEPEDSNEVDKVLQEYAEWATKPSEGKKSGAILLAVIGAKLSEGLNFADDLARGVIIVGLPFANIGSPELRERLKYVKALEARRGLPRPSGQKDAAAELYENMCMNAVNQSIGRAIRHRNDWASLLLLDCRYASASIRNKLPKWIGNKIIITESFGHAVKTMSSFYRGKRPH
ncbi:helicase C-terminal domain-containing protein [Panaeolus papilionaceus]|nr:helicase C-terminal domain-containing protein [Panaeolus papilionaceus]